MSTPVYARCTQEKPHGKKFHKGAKIASELKKKKDKMKEDNSS